MVANGLPPIEEGERPAEGVLAAGGAFLGEPPLLTKEPEHAGSMGTMMWLACP